MKTTIEEIKSNKALHDNTIAFNPIRPQRLGMTQKKGAPPDMGSGYAVRSDGEVLENGDVVLSMYAKGAHKVEVVMSRGKVVIALKERDDGVFEGTIPYDQANAGFKFTEFRVDGVTVINPYAPICFGGNRAQNYFEFPEPEAEFMLLKDVAHGAVTREFFYSESLSEWECCNVYTPPGYAGGGEYPVLYLQHGAGENENCWVYNGKMQYILDNLLAENLCEPFIVVMNDGMIKMPHEATIMDSFDGITAIITRDCRQFIESKYRVKKSKWDRAIAGLSLGSMQSSYIGFSYPELFGYVGLFSGFMRRRDNHNTYDQNPYLNILKDAERFEREYKLFYRAIGDKDGHYDEFIEDSEFCANYGINNLDQYVSRVYHGFEHEWSCWRRAFRDFAQLIFR